jgi:glycosyltransferase involved in cell wall biosynthesis
VRIVVDVTPLSHPRTGIGNYIRGMLGGLAEAAGDRNEVVAFAPVSMQSRARLEDALDGIPVERRLISVPPLGHVWRTLWSRSGLLPVERLAGALDVFHFSDWMYPPQRGGLRTTTIYDLIPLHFPEWVHPRTRAIHLRKYRHAVKTCDQIAAISSFTADDIAERLKFPRERIVVAYPGVDERFRPEGPSREGDYILMLAPDDPRKNYEAMASGTPVVSSSHSSLDEASGDAAVRVDPKSPEAIAAGIERALTEGQSLSARGVAHAKRFTWRACGEAHLEGFTTGL